MTYEEEERITPERAIQMLSGSSIGCYEADEMGAFAIKTLLEMRWHDLRKDPEDLPKHDDVYVVVSTDWSGEEVYETSEYENGKFKFPDVFAWMPFPPFGWVAFPDCD